MISLLKPDRATFLADVDPIYVYASERLLCGPLRLLSALCRQSFLNRRERQGLAKGRKGKTEKDALSSEAPYWDRGRLARNERAARTHLFARLGTCIGVVLQLLFFASLAHGQVTTPSPKPTPEPAVMGTIRGRVVSSDGRPLPNANVMAQGVSATPSIKMKSSDAEGAFVLEDVAAGLYIVTANAPGYIDEAMTIGDPTDLPRYLIGSRVKITMIKGGVLTGTVTDSKGQPVVGAPVIASLSGAATSLSGFMTGTMGETDDRGIYRLYGLTPGSYIIAAGGSAPFGTFSTSGFELDVPTFYPSSTRDTAVPVAVRSGDEASGIDIKYRGTEGHAISGVVVGSVETGNAGGAVFVMLSPAGTSSIQAMSLTTALEQRRVFNFSGLADGDYDLFAGFQGGPTENQLVATKRVTVRNGDVTGVELKLILLGSITGNITLDPIKDEDKCDKRASQVLEVMLKTPRDEPKKAGAALMPGLFGNIGTLLNAKGEFNIRNVEAGKYRFAFKLPTDAWYVRAIASGPGLTIPAERPANRTPAAGTPTLSAKATPSTSSAGTAPNALSEGVVTVKATERISGVTIAIGQNAAGLKGKVAGSNEGAAVPGGLHVHLVPAEREHANNVLRYGEAAVNSDGSFALTNLAPGRYLIVSRIKAETAAGARSRDLAWDAAARAKLRTAAEAANVVVELNPCQRLNDYSLSLQPIP